MGRGGRRLQRDGHAALTLTVTLLQALDGDAERVPGADLFPAGEEGGNNVHPWTKASINLALKLLMT